ncbi:DUF397 domain-containing protein [Streptomyces somaliensis DSM 40738]|uniref:DUF397 domain-containing protein n=1 Tax=Streptomyces somaliensis (strain ATCC 33201 / DSM 40738 / JCM 12659 / KCTC 9044 / NCTC 11332 / NRRL B-12077 / IP 733) TaxID=1134445 RepID=A0AA44DAU8_STRE0|nr:DUF397 domain-containing protein [Streptomyces somaliensis]MCQ0024540.1 DUF397 domain-containing protein [Streptomyces somaliensis DSM 40738]NKY13010.1 DUF397 domain-containing protein [Streptomyces somaliensis DSM 40738]
MSDTLRWPKSGHSSPGGGECVETALDWHASSYSGDWEDACVEVAACSRTVHVRDSKSPDGGSLTVAPSTWEAFLAGATAP